MARRRARRAPATIGHPRLLLHSCLPHYKFTSRPCRSDADKRALERTPAGNPWLPLGELCLGTDPPNPPGARARTAPPAGPRPAPGAAAACASERRHPAAGAIPPAAPAAASLPGLGRSASALRSLEATRATGAKAMRHSGGPDMKQGGRASPQAEVRWAAVKSQRQDGATGRHRLAAVLDPPPANLHPWAPSNGSAPPCDPA